MKRLKVFDRITYKQALDCGSSERFFTFLWAVLLNNKCKDIKGGFCYRDAETRDFVFMGRS